ADGIGAVVPVDRRAAARRQLGHDHPGRPGPALHAADGGAGAGHRHRRHRAGPQHLRRRRARCPRPALEAAHPRRLMFGAVVTRLGQMLFVMFGISVLVFLIFFATPGADPAARIAGRNASPETLAAVRKDFGFDRPLYVQYGRLMERLFITRDLTSFVNRGWKVVPAVVDVAPGTLSLVIGAATLSGVGGVLIRLVAAATRGNRLHP